jgi:2-C-methyl-D-erythritol 4-phosphate cytidylyltransferase
VLVHSLAALAGSPDVSGAVVVVASEEVESVRQSLAESPVAAFVRAVVAGGETRQASVTRGVEAVSEDVAVVLVHDAARPFVRPGEVTAVVRAMQRYEAAALAVPVADTLRRSGGDVFGETVPRDSLWRMQTPQGARRETLVAALARAEREGWAGTDEVGLLQRAGVEVALVEGDERNLKITRPADWALAKALWAAR